jgi:hypothetical protein
MLDGSAKADDANSLQRSIADIYALERLKSVSDQQIKSFCASLNLEWNDAQVHISTDPDYVHTLWSRKDMEIPTTTGHQKRFHKVLNQLTAGCKIFEERSESVADGILEQKANHEVDWARQSKKMFRQLGLEAKNRAYTRMKKCPGRSFDSSDIFLVVLASTVSLLFIPWRRKRFTSSKQHRGLWQIDQSPSNAQTLRKPPKL